MNGEVAQITALVCHANAVLRGMPVPPFADFNVTTRFCESIEFLAWWKPLIGKVHLKVMAENPDEWLGMLPDQPATAVRLIREDDEKTVEVSDWELAGFSGGAGLWLMEVLKGSGTSEFWAARWEVLSEEERQRAGNTWKVSYGLVKQAETQPSPLRDITTVKEEFRGVLQAIHDFAAREERGNFTHIFADALELLDHPSPEAETGLTPRGCFPESEAMLQAAMASWVFGGMGSWNDLGFDGAAQEEYEKVSANLYEILNEVIATAASRTAVE